MDKQSIDRINELSRIAKERALTEAETEERARLRQAYVAAFRAETRATLDHTVVQQDDGSKQPLRDYLHKK